MAITVYQWAVTVMLTRLVNRTGGAASSATQAFKQIDITPYLGPGGVVRTIKDINQPCGGFSVSFADKIHPEFLDTVYALVEPMDLIEIRASRTPYLYQGTTLPLIMRGFVSAVDRAEAMSEDGSPQRMVTISGQDMGKLFQINQVFFELAPLLGNDYLNTFHLESSTGIEVAVLPVNDFMHQLVEKIINPKIQRMGVFAATQLTPFTVDASVPDGVVLPQLAQSIDAGPIWQLADTFADRPWNEMFVQDFESGPHFVFRPAPYRSLIDRSYIINGAQDPGTIEVKSADVVAMTMSRSDARVANFFWVPPGASQLDTNAFVNVAALQNGWPLDLSYDNNNPTLFGIRKMTVGSNLYPSSITEPVQMLPFGSQPPKTSGVVQWNQARGKQLTYMNRDNSAFEEGGMVIKGSEDITMGKYLRLIRGDLRSEAYVAQVSHNFVPLQVWTTSVRLIRGNGFYERNQTSGSPWVMEGRSGPYSQ